MTTIIYDHKRKQIACDSRTTIGSLIIDDESIKFKQAGDKLWFISGSKGDADTFINHYEPLTKGNDFMDVDAIFLITNGSFEGGVYMAIKNEDHIYKECIVDHNYATGSGDVFALSALDFGKTAKEAVEYAITRDIYSGGKVHVYDIKSKEWL